MVMIEFDTFELDNLAGRNITASMMEKIVAAQRMNAAGESGIVYFNGVTSEEKDISISDHQNMSKK